MKNQTKFGKILSMLLIVEYYGNYRSAGFRLWNPLTWITILITLFLNTILFGFQGLKESFEDLLSMQKSYINYKKGKKND